MLVFWYFFFCFGLTDFVSPWNVFYKQSLALFYDHVSNILNTRYFKGWKFEQQKALLKKLSNQDKSRKLKIPTWKCTVIPPFTTPKISGLWLSQILRKCTLSNFRLKNSIFHSPKCDIFYLELLTFRYIFSALAGPISIIFFLVFSLKCPLQTDGLFLISC